MPRRRLGCAGCAGRRPAYLVDARLADRFDGFEVVGVTSDGRTVTVTLRAAVHMPFVNLLSSRYNDGYPVEAAATARSPFLP